MRTTLDIDVDVLQAVKELARRQHRTAGQVISELARRALTSPGPSPGTAEPKGVYGLQPFPPRGNVITNELIDRLRDEDAY